MNFKDRWVLVTGASSGLGYTFAKMLAFRHGAHVVAVARRAEKLEELRREVEQAGRKLLPLAADLSNPEHVERVLEEVMQRVPLYAAILNAGVTHFGRYDELPFLEFQAMLNTNVVSTVRLTTELLPHLERRGEGGGVLLVASMAGITPVPYQAAYSGTKAFLVHFGCSLWHEVQGKNVSITVYAPGGIATEMTAGNNFGKLRSWLMPVEPVAEAGLAAFMQRSYLTVPGIMNRIGTALMKLLPAKLVTSRLAAAYRRSLDSAR